MVGRSNEISRESRCVQAEGDRATASPKGPVSDAPLDTPAVRAFIVAMKPESINRWSEGR
jgi:hypothetical protein